MPVDLSYALLQPYQFNYEITNFRGDVQAVVTADSKTACTGEDEFTAYLPQIQTVTDFYSFGSPMKNRTDNQQDYRFGFNGQDRDDEIAGIGAINTAEYWEYDTRLGRRWNIDPVDQISISNYVVFADNPINNTDVLGDDVVYGSSKSQRKAVRKDIRRNMKISKSFKDVIRQQKRDHSTNYVYSRSTDPLIEAILPEEAKNRLVNPTFDPAGKNESNVKSRVSVQYNPSGNNIGDLDAEFVENTNEISKKGNAKEIAEKLNKLFFINKTVKWSVRGSTTADKSNQNMTLAQQENSNRGFVINGIEDTNYKLKNLLDARAKAGAELLVEEGVNPKYKERITSSKMRIYNDTIGVKSKPQIK